jgi:hypothetical protein
MGVPLKNADVEYKSGWIIDEVAGGRVIHKQLIREEQAMGTLTT